MLSSKNEDGPFEIFARFRYYVGVRYDAEGNLDPQNELAKLVSCMYCNSVWIAGLFLILLVVSPRWTSALASPLAVSAGALLLENK